MTRDNTIVKAHCFDGSDGNSNDARGGIYKRARICSVVCGFSLSCHVLVHVDELRVVQSTTGTVLVHQVLTVVV